MKSGKIRVDINNSRMYDDKLYITDLKALGIKSKFLSDKIDWHNNAVHPTLGRLVQYSGAYTRAIK